MNQLVTARSYIIGFVLSLATTLLAYLAVVNHWLQGPQLIGLVVGLAIIQLVVQLVCFLHLGREAKPRWNLIVFLFMLLVIGIVVIGSLWIMNNLNYNMMPHEMDEYMLEQSNKGF